MKIFEQLPQKKLTKPQLALGVWELDVGWISVSEHGVHHHVNAGANAVAGLVKPTKKQ